MIGRLAIFGALSGLSFLIYLLSSSTSVSNVAQPSQPSQPSPSASDDTLVFMALGDWGRTADGSSTTTQPTYDTPGSAAYVRDFYAQKNVSVQMAAFARQTPTAFLLNVGDNFYWNGVRSTSDALWTTAFEQVYADASLQFPWYSVLGNHDYGGGGCPDWWSADAQVEYTFLENQNRWKMPARYFTEIFVQSTYTVQIWMLDTNYANLGEICDYAYCPTGKPSTEYLNSCINDLTTRYTDMILWFKSSLAASSAEWKIVIGHHPLEFFGEDQRQMFNSLFDTYGVQAYYSGHTHCGRHDQLYGSKLTTEMFVSGAGGGYQEGGGNSARYPTLWFKPTYQFMVNYLTATELRSDFIDYLGNVIYSYTHVRALSSTKPPSSAK